VSSDGAMQRSFAGSKILLIEDDTDTAILVQLVLEDAGATTTVASTARDATRILSSTLQRIGNEPDAAAVGARRFDLLVLDLRLSDGDGAELLLNLRSAGYRLPPVIVVSALAHQATDTAAVRLDAVHVVYKPFELRTLLDCIDDALRRRP